ncbi:peptidylprolyl isomerase [bacterium]|nr:peptidylprolyl isomerase [bacterium]
MKRFLIFALIISMFTLCSKKPEQVKLKKGTRAYNLAADLSAITPQLNPEENNVIISTNIFNITTGEIVQVINYSPDEFIKKLLRFHRNKVKNIVEGMAKNLAEKKLLVYSAKKSGIEISDSEVDTAMSEIFKNYGGETKFNMTLRENGMDKEYIAEDVKNSLFADKYLKKIINPKIAVTENDIKNYYNQDTTVTLRQIMAATGNREKHSIDLKRRIIGTVLKMAKKGVDFAVLAKRYSEDANTRENGGLMENIRKGSTEASFDSAAFATPVGKISGVFRTSYGFHILKVLKKKAGLQSYDKVKDTIKREIYLKRWQKEKEAVVDSLKKEYHYRFIPLY